MQIALFILMSYRLRRFRRIFKIRFTCSIRISNAEDGGEWCAAVEFGLLNPALPALRIILLSVSNLHVEISYLLLFYFAPSQLPPFTKSSILSILNLSSYESYHRDCLACF